MSARAGRSASSCSVRRGAEQGVANIGLAVDAGCRRQGVGDALLGAALALCHDWLALRRVELETYTDNAAAIALFRKHGFELEGTARDYAFRAGRYVDVHLMAHLRAPD
jgi:L-phenylalanine/L-methionine N-acetyltransferase